MEPDYIARVEMNTLFLKSTTELKHHFLLELLNYSLKDEYNPFKNAIFPNTLVHRQKLRMWQSILMLLPVINEMQGEDAGNVLNLVWQAIDGENMASTRYYMEFFAIRIILRHPVLLGMLWQRLNNWHAGSSVCISALIVSYHVGRKLSDMALFGTFFDSCVPYFLHNSHTVRIYATKIYYDLYQFYFTNSGERTTGLALDNLYEFIGSSEACGRFIQKLCGDHFLCDFDPMEDYNLHFLVSELPKRAEVAQDETYPGVAFSANCPIPISKSYTYNQNTLKREVGEGGVLRPTSPNMEGDIFQQKIVPFELGRYDLEMSEYNQEQLNKKREERDGKIIMCASLVEKTPNLAGLSRTCEILGATQLVVPAISILESQDFRNISMTSDRWLQITETKPSELLNSLLKWRMDGYKIVAVEQTSESVSLERFEFPRRVVLVLGGESQGIPAHILQIVDDCVEIPQFGLTRSLNVHVSGSLVLWELRRQRIVSSSTNIANINE